MKDLLKTHNRPMATLHRVDLTLRTLMQKLIFQIVIAQVLMYSSNSGLASTSSPGLQGAEVSSEILTSGESSWTAATEPILYETVFTTSSLTETKTEPLQYITLIASDSISTLTTCSNSVRDPSSDGYEIAKFTSLESVSYITPMKTNMILTSLTGSIQHHSTSTIPTHTSSMQDASSDIYEMNQFTSHEFVIITAVSSGTTSLVNDQITSRKILPYQTGYSCYKSTPSITSESTIVDYNSIKHGLIPSDGITPLELSRKTEELSFITSILLGGSSRLVAESGSSRTTLTESLKSRLATDGSDYGLGSAATKITESYSTSKVGSMISKRTKFSSPESVTMRTIIHQSDLKSNTGSISIESIMPASSLKPLKTTLTTKAHGSTKSKTSDYDSRLNSGSMINKMTQLMSSKVINEGRPISSTESISLKLSMLALSKHLIKTTKASGSTKSKTSETNSRSAINDGSPSTGSISLEPSMPATTEQGTATTKALKSSKSKSSENDSRLNSRYVSNKMTQFKSSEPLKISKPSASTSPAINEISPISSTGSISLEPSMLATSPQLTSTPKAAGFTQSKSSEDDSRLNSRSMMDEISLTTPSESLMITSVLCKTSPSTQITPKNTAISHQTTDNGWENKRIGSTSLEMISYSSEIKPGYSFLLTSIIKATPSLMTGDHGATAISSKGYNIPTTGDEVLSSIRQTSLLSRNSSVDSKRAKLTPFSSGTHISSKRMQVSTILDSFTSKISSLDISTSSTSSIDLYTSSTSSMDLSTSSTSSMDLSTSSTSSMDLSTSSTSSMDLSTSSTSSMDLSTSSTSSMDLSTSSTSSMDLSTSSTSSMDLSTSSSSSMDLSTSSTSSIDLSTSSTSSMDLSTSSGSSLNSSTSSISLLESFTSRTTLLESSTSRTTLLESTTSSISLLKPSTLSTSLLESSTTSILLSTLSTSSTLLLNSSTSSPSLLDLSTSRTSLLYKSTSSTSLLYKSTSSTSLLDSSASRTLFLSSSTPRTSFLDSFTSRTSLLGLSTFSTSFMDSSTSITSLLYKSTSSTSLLDSSTPSASLIESSTSSPSLLDSSTSRTSLLKSFTLRTSLLKSSIPRTSFSDSSSSSSLLLESSTSRSSLLYKATLSTSLLYKSTSSTSLLDSSTSRTSFLDLSTSSTLLLDSSTLSTSFLESYTSSTSLLDSSISSTSLLYKSTSSTSLLDTSTSRISFLDLSTSSTSLLKTFTSSTSLLESYTSSTSLLDLFTPRTSFLDSSTSSSSLLKSSTSSTTLLESSTSSPSLLDSSTSSPSLLDSSTSRTSLLESSTSSTSLLYKSTSSKSLLYKSTSSTSLLDSSNSSSLLLGLSTLSTSSTSSSSLLDKSTSSTLLLESSASRTSFLSSSTSKTSFLYTFTSRASLLGSSTLSTSYNSSPLLLDSSIPSTSLLESSTSCTSFLESYTSSSPWLALPTSSSSLLDSWTSRTSLLESFTSRISLLYKFTSSTSLLYKSTLSSLLLESSTSRTSFLDLTISSTSLSKTFTSSTSLLESSTSSLLESSTSRISSLDPSTSNSPLSLLSLSITYHWSSSGNSSTIGAETSSMLVYSSRSIHLSESTRMISNSLISTPISLSILRASSIEPSYKEITVASGTLVSTLLARSAYSLESTPSVPITPASESIATSSLSVFSVSTQSPATGGILLTEKTELRKKYSSRSVFASKRLPSSFAYALSPPSPSLLYSAGIIPSSSGITVTLKTKTSEMISTPVSITEPSTSKLSETSEIHYSKTTEILPASSTFEFESKIIQALSSLSIELETSASISTSITGTELSTSKFSEISRIDNSEKIKILPTPTFESKITESVHSSKLESTTSKRISTLVTSTELSTSELSETNKIHYSKRTEILPTSVKFESGITEAVHSSKLESTISERISTSATGTELSTSKVSATRTFATAGSLIILKSSKIGDTLIIESTETKIKSTLLTNSLHKPETTENLQSTTATTQNLSIVKAVSFISREYSKSRNSFVTALTGTTIRSSLLSSRIHRSENTNALQSSLSNMISYCSHSFGPSLTIHSSLSQGSLTANATEIASNSAFISSRLYPKESISRTPTTVAFVPSASSAFSALYKAYQTSESKGRSTTEAPGKTNAAKSLPSSIIRILASTGKLQSSLTSAISALIPSPKPSMPVLQSTLTDKLTTKAFEITKIPKLSMRISISLKDTTKSQMPSFLTRPAYSSADISTRNESSTVKFTKVTSRLSAAVSSKIFTHTKESKTISPSSTMPSSSSTSPSSSLTKHHKLSTLEDISIKSSSEITNELSTVKSSRIYTQESKKISQIPMKFSYSPTKPFSSLTKLYELSTLEDISIKSFSEITDTLSLLESSKIYTQETDTVPPISLMSSYSPSRTLLRLSTDFELSTVMDSSISVAISGSIKMSVRSKRFSPESIAIDVTDQSRFFSSSPSITTSKPKVILRINVNIEITMNLGNSLKKDGIILDQQTALDELRKSSELRTRMEAILTEMVRESLQNDTELREKFIGCMDFQFSNGSIIAKFRTVFQKAISTQKTMSVQKLLVGYIASKNSSITRNNIQFYVTPGSLKVEDFNECKYPSGTFCHNHATCTNLPLEFTFRCDCNYGYTGNGTSCVAKRISQNDKELSGLAIGLGVFFGIVFIGIVVFAVFLTKKKIQERNKVHDAGIKLHQRRIGWSEA